MLFPDEDNTIDIASDAYLLKGFLLGQGEQILAELSAVISQAPLRHMEWLCHVSRDDQLWRLGLGD